MTKPIIFIMAGGLGKRMCSEIPKVLHLVQDKPMLVHVIENSWKLSPQKIIIIVGKYRTIIEQTLKDSLDSNIFDNLKFAHQPEAKGTGNAILCGLNYISDSYDPNSQILILSGDTPLVSSKTMSLLLDKTFTAKIMTTNIEDPSGYGRVILSNNNFIKIVEHKDCNDQELLVNNVNTGIYSVSLRLLQEFIPRIENNNSQQEYYLTDLFSLLKDKNILVDIYQMPEKNQIELIGINTKEQLDKLNKVLKNR